MKKFLLILIFTLFCLSCVSVVIQQTGRDDVNTQQEDNDEQKIIGENNAQ